MYTSSLKVTTTCDNVVNGRTITPERKESCGEISSPLFLPSSIFLSFLVELFFDTQSKKVEKERRKEREIEREKEGE